MKSSEICALAINIVAGNYGATTYRMGNEQAVDWPYNNMTWFPDAWRSDCLGFVRAVLCGWNADKNALCGGANYSYPCYNYGEWDFVYSCSNYFYDFTNLSLNPCTLLMKESPYRHVGLYVGEFQLNGKTYNVCECTSALNGCYPTWIDPDGTRRYEMGGSALGTPWLVWGIFDLSGVKYGITEYDGGSTGATGFGSELSEDEVEYYWGTVGDPSYDYLESLADTLYGMDASTFAIMAGWEYGEGYQAYDKYMGYLCAGIPVNGFMGYNQQTPQALASWIAGGDSSSYYSVAQMTNRANQCASDTSLFGTQTRIALLLALLNPNQKVVFCNGVPPKPSADRIVYEMVLPSGVEIWAFGSAYGDQTYDITGSGIRGGTPDPAGRGKHKLPVWMYLRPYYYYNIYRRR